MANCTKCGRTLSSFSVGRKSAICKWCQQYEAAQRGETSEDDVQPIMAPPWLARESSGSFVTQAFVGLNVAVFLGMLLAGVSVMEPTSRQLLDWGANFAPLTFGGQWWRLLTSVFIHIGAIHIAFNMWCLWDLGSLAESLYGRTMYAFVYLATGVAGSLASAGFHGATVSAGASGAIFGLAGALIASFYFGEFSLPRIAIQAKLRSVVMFAGYNLVFGAVSGRTDNAAHAGGLIAGLILGTAIAKLAPDSDQTLRRTGIAVLAIAVVVGSFGWMHQSRSYLIHLSNGNELLDEGKYDAAIREFEAAAIKRPNDTEVHFELAHGYYMAKMYSKAETELKRILQINPKDEPAYYELGDVYSQEKRFGEAREMFLKVTELDPNSAEAHFGLGSLAAAEGNHTSAIAEYNTAASLDTEGELTGTHYNIGLSYLQLKQFDQAIAAFRKEQEVSGDSVETEVALTETYEAKGMKQEAEAARQRATKLKATVGPPNEEK